MLTLLHPGASLPDQLVLTADVTPEHRPRTQDRLAGVMTAEVTPEHRPRARERQRAGMRPRNR